MVRTKEKKIKKLILFLGAVILCGLVLMLGYYVKYQKDKEEKEREQQKAMKVAEEYNWFLIHFINVYKTQYSRINIIKML